MYAKVKLKWIEQGLCVICHKPRELLDKKRCNSCIQKYNQNRKCIYTGQSLKIGDNLSIDHIVPKAQNGTNEINNLQWVDYKTNMMKRDMDHGEFINTMILILKNLGYKIEK